MSSGDWRGGAISLRPTPLYCLTSEVDASGRWLVPAWPTAKSPVEHPSDAWREGGGEGESTGYRIQA